MKPPAVRMTWSDLLFLHWPVDTQAIATLLPPGLEVDTFDGSAWVGLVPFTMPQVRPRWWPRRPALPGLTAFHECNVRTYVRCGDEAGVWFLSLDAASHVAVKVARRRWHLPYEHARIDLEHRAGEVHYRVDRSESDAAMRCVWRSGNALPPSRPGGPEHFLTERYMLFAFDGETLYRGRIDHHQWPLRSATVLDLEDTLVAAAGLNVTGKPAFMHAAAPIDVAAWGLEEVLGLGS